MWVGSTGATDAVMAGGGVCTAEIARAPLRWPMRESGWVSPNSPKFAPSPTVAANVVSAAAPAIAAAFRLTICLSQPFRDPGCIGASRGGVERL